MWPWLVILIQLAGLGPVLAQDDIEPGQAGAIDARVRVAQKIRLLEQILNSPELLRRVEDGSNAAARELLDRATRNFADGESYYQRGLYLEADAVLDYVLRDLNAGSRLSSRPRRAKKAYRNFIAQLDALVLTDRPDLDDRQRESLRLRLERVASLRDRATGLAGDGAYEEAIALLEEAYREKAALIDDYPGETTVVYDLEFDTAQEEYRHLIDRSYHYLELVQIALAQASVDEQTRRLTDSYLYRSMLDLETAEELETRAKFAEAIPLLDESISRLSAVLKLLGITI